MNTSRAFRLPAPSSPRLWQIVHHGWDDFLVRYEKHHRKSLGPLRPATTATVQSFLRCGDLASGFTRMQCPDCGHERLLAFTCKGRHFCPSCHQRRTRTTGQWIATASSTPSATPNSSAPANSPTSSLGNTPASTSTTAANNPSPPTTKPDDDG